MILIYLGNPGSRGNVLALTHGKTFFPIDSDDRESAAATLGGYDPEQTYRDPSRHCTGGTLRRIAEQRFSGFHLAILPRTT